MPKKTGIMKPCKTCGEAFYCVPHRLETASYCSWECKPLPTNRAHGHTSGRVASATYNSWAAMLKRCRDTNCNRYERYGGRNITVCDRWLDFTNFLADMGERPIGTSLDRINNDGNYEPGNCQWSTPKKQSRNTRSNNNVIFNGKKMCLMELSEISGVDYSTLRYRIKVGWPVDLAASLPANRIPLNRRNKK